ncbi:transglycosylase SLT domain-containing protein [Amycolatopsis echigonensis]|nr:transglycosylase SLT domain-containing protein [Amycolatopsis niigatensis]
MSLFGEFAGTCVAAGAFPTADWLLDRVLNQQDSINGHARDLKATLETIAGKLEAVAYDLQAVDHHNSADLQRQLSHDLRDLRNAVSDAPVPPEGSQDGSAGSASGMPWHDLVASTLPSGDAAATGNGTYESAVGNGANESAAAPLASRAPGGPVQPLALALPASGATFDKESAPARTSGSQLKPLAPAGGGAGAPGGGTAQATPAPVLRSGDSSTPHVIQTTSHDPGPAFAGVTPTGNVADWIHEAVEILRANGVNVSDAQASIIAAIIQHESGGDPSAINNYDCNAAAGHPSIGLMQCIDSTFNAYKLPGHDVITNPVDNIIAGVRYALARYGSLDNVPGIQALAAGGAYVGY